MSKHIKALIFTASCIVAFMLSIILVNQSEAGGFNLFELDEVKIQYKDFFDGGSHPLITQNGIPGKALGKEINLILNADFLTYLYLHNTVHSLTDQGIDGSNGQFRTVSWQYNLGIRLTKFLNVSYIHRSEHLLDYVWPMGHFPLEDAIMFEIKFYKKDKINTLLKF